ncbi:MAG: MBL fold metallo-hydrolase [Candidatus Woesearchaeota archaeon]
MLPTIKLTDNVIKVLIDPCVYIIIDEKIVIDTSQYEYKKELKETINKFVPIQDIKFIILTHLHYDHLGNINLFPNAQFFASPEITNISKEKLIDYILNKQIVSKFNIKLNDITKNNKLKKLFEIYQTPGHCKSCITFYYKKENILFTGDTYFNKDCFGRTDLPTSEPETMQKSLNIINQLIKKYNPIIAPGHDY